MNLYLGGGVMLTIPWPVLIGGAFLFVGLWVAIVFWVWRRFFDRGGDGERG